MLPAFKVVVPARYASVRLPGKPLLDIAGKPMVIRVVEQAMASGATQVVVATDHADIAAVVEAHGFRAVMTSPEHASGTDRIAEVAAIEGWADDDIVVNVQGDEPLMEPVLIREVAYNLAGHTDAAVSTACHLIDDGATLFNPNVVKVVSDQYGYALYFSRAPIPWVRDSFVAGMDSTELRSIALPEGMPIHRHVGIYAYRVSFLQIYSKLEPAPIEQLEALEQLRALWHGYRISVAVTECAPAAGVDTDADLARVRHTFASL